MINIVLFYFTASSMCFATSSGIQLFLKLYLAIELLVYKIEISSFPIFYYNDCPMSTL